MPAKILIVEDERITAEDLRDILTDLGHTVTGSVASGAEAIAQAEQNPPDLALMDIRIKGEMDGTETARILRERFNIPVVYLTAHADSSTLPLSAAPSCHNPWVTSPSRFRKLSCTPASRSLCTNTRRI